MNRLIKESVGLASRRLPALEFDDLDNWAGARIDLAMWVGLACRLCKAN